MRKWANQDSSIRWKTSMNNSNEHAKTAIAHWARQERTVVFYLHYDNWPAEWTVQP